VDVPQVVRRLVVNGVGIVTKAFLAAHQDMATAAERVGVARTGSHTHGIQLTQQVPRLDRLWPKGQVAGS
jgi:hypothetical protein